MAVMALMLIVVVALASADQYHRLGHGFRAQKPPTFDSWHPALRTLNAYVDYNQLLIERLADDNETQTIDVMSYDKEVLHRSHRHHFGAVSQRRFNTQQFINGFISTVEADGTSAALNAATGGLYGCATDLVNDIIAIYNYFENGSDPSIGSTISSVASTVSDCLSGAVSNIPILGTLVSFVKMACSADDIYEHCSPLINDLQSEVFDDYKIGSDVGACVTAIAAAARRRRSVHVGTVPSQWVCNPDFFNATDGCDVGCGAFDPDCYSGDQRTFFPRGTPHPPAEWFCPALYYGTQDGCDVGCGAADPDCSTERSAVTYGWNSSQDFSISAYYTLAQTFLATAAVNQDNNDSEGQHYQTATIAVVAVLGTTLIVLGALVYKFRHTRRTAKAQAEQLAQLIPEQETSQDAYADHHAVDLQADSRRD